MYIQETKKYDLRRNRQWTGRQKKGAGKLLPVISLFRAQNSDSDLQLAVTVQLCYIYKENSLSSYPEHN
jgi:hypothetical protein